MLSPEKIYKKLICSTCKDSHIILEPVLLECGDYGCKQCIQRSAYQTIECFNCKQLYWKNDLLFIPIDTKIKENNNAFNYINENFREKLDFLKGK